MPVPVIDLFAGPGGLGEGFARETSSRFDIVVSIEKDEMAHDTLRLRAAHRALMRDSAGVASTWADWDSIVEATPWNVVFHTLRDCSNPAIRRACAIADREALCIELGPTNRESVSSAIRERLTHHSGHSVLPPNSVLIGGPPCQAYSIVGRSRNRGKSDYRAEADHRHFLYVEYLHVIAEFRPAIFVMENVKGILTSKVKDKQIFQTILQDLKRPDVATGVRQPVEYVLTSLSGSGDLLSELAPEDFIVRAEAHSVPQARHRVIIVGIRRDVFERAGPIDKLSASERISVWDVIQDLPVLRPQLSFRGKGLQWQDALDDPSLELAIRQLRTRGTEHDSSVAKRMDEIRTKLRNRRDPGWGGDRLRLPVAAMAKPLSSRLNLWFRDRPTTLLSNHECRAHMPADLVRYLFVSTYGEVTGTSPKLRDFPVCLLPQHKNVDPENLDSSIFKDRFRVQLANECSMTVTSHIAKDGHAFIHPRPAQCRSLTVREAARLQTFPDTYVFLGNRTSQYTQVGNAVPPFLAAQIASLVASVLRKAGIAEASPQQRIGQRRRNVGRQWSSFHSAVSR